MLKIEETLLHVNSLYSRSLWICEEKELVHEIAGLGELRSPWHESQMAWLQNHLNLINAYSQALESLDAAKGRFDFRSFYCRGFPCMTSSATDQT